MRTLLRFHSAPFLSLFLFRSFFSRRCPIFAHPLNPFSTGWLYFDHGAKQARRSPLSLPFILVFFVGITLGLFGGGGTILLLPLLVYLFSIDLGQAIPIAQLTLFFASVAAFIPPARRGEVDARVALTLGLAGIVFAALGALVSPLIPPAALLIFFSLLMLTAGARMWFAKNPEEEGGQCRPRSALLIGSLIGFISGMTGAGGGFLLVPSMIMFCGIPMQKAIGTAFLVIALQSLSGFLTQITHTSIDLAFTASVIGLSAAGGVVGGMLSRRINVNILKRAFAVFILIIGLFVLFQEIVSL